MLNIYLDDVRKAPVGFTLASNYRQCIRMLEINKGNVEILSLDHDLGAKKSGYDVARWMVENNVFPNIIHLHTANPVGRDNMYQLLMRYKPEHVEVYKYPIN